MDKENMHQALQDIIQTATQALSGVERPWKSAKTSVLDFITSECEFGDVEESRQSIWDRYLRWLGPQSFSVESMRKALFAELRKIGCSDKRNSTTRFICGVGPKRVDPTESVQSVKTSDQQKWGEWLRERNAVQGPCQSGQKPEFWFWAGLSLSTQRGKWRVVSSDYEVGVKGKHFTSPEEAAAYILVARESEDDFLQHLPASAEALVQSNLFVYLEDATEFLWAIRKRDDKSIQDMRVSPESLVRARARLEQERLGE